VGGRWPAGACGRRAAVRALVQHPALGTLGRIASPVHFTVEQVALRDVATPSLRSQGAPARHGAGTAAARRCAWRSSGRGGPRSYGGDGRLDASCRLHPIAAPARTEDRPSPARRERRCTLTPPAHSSTSIRTHRVQFPAAEQRADELGR
jgi:hypothetical protein